MYAVWISVPLEPITFYIIKFIFIPSVRSKGCPFKNRKLLLARSLCHLKHKKQEGEKDFHCRGINPALPQIDIQVSMLLHYS